MGAQTVAVKLRPGAAKAVTSNFSSVQQVQRAMLVKLKDSCLSATDAKELQLQPYTATDSAQLQLTINRAGFKIPYFNTKGRPTDFFRYRYLEYDNARGFGKLVHSANGNGNGNGNGHALKGDLRYTQPAATMPQLYFSPQVPWRKVLPDAKRPLIFTEGELKAACGCNHGLLVVGLGGVWNFKSNKQGVPILPVFTEIALDGRDVYVCYDSDSANNAQVCQAEQAFAQQLLQLGARVYICRIPQEGETKVGLDDYIRLHGPEKLQTLVLDAADTYRACEALFKLNGEVVYVQDPGVIMKLSTFQRISARAFVDHAYSDRIWYDQVPVDDKNVKVVPKSAPKEWLKWPFRSTVQRVTYRPGQPRFLQDGEFNTWPGWGRQPAKGNVDPWHALLTFIFHGWDDAAARRRWFEQWLAYPLQHPGVKLNQSAVLWSVAQGTGKSLLGYTLKQIYGENFNEINDRHLYGSFNGWAENKQFVMGDEIASSGERKRELADRMKNMITQRDLIINQKYVPEYRIPDCINYYFTSNHPDAFFMEDRDRRFFIHEIQGNPKPLEFYQDYTAWMERTGASHIFQHLLDLDLSGFNPEGDAMQTASKTDMIDIARGEISDWCARLRIDPDSVLRLGKMVMPYQLWTAEELYKLYDSDGSKRSSRCSVVILARELRRAGFARIGNGITMRTKTAGITRLWLIRPPAHPFTSTKQAVDLFDGERAGREKGVKY